MGSVRRKGLLYRSGPGFSCVNHVRVNHVQDWARECRYHCYASLPGPPAEYGDCYRSRAQRVRAFCKRHHIHATTGC